MLGQLTHQSPKGASEEMNKDRAAALEVYKQLTYPEQKKEFVADFFAEEKGKGGRNIKCMVEWVSKVTVKQDITTTSVEDYMTRPWKRNNKTCITNYKLNFTSMQLIV